MEQYIKGSIKFYDDEKEILFPPSYDQFNTKLVKMLGLTEDLLKSLNISYLDDDNDNVEINNKDDYQQFFEFSKETNGKIQINIEIKEDSKIDIKQCSNSILSFVEKNNIENINIVGEDKNSALLKGLNSGVTNNNPKTEKFNEDLSDDNIINENNIDDNIINENNIDENNEKRKKESKKENIQNQINRNENIAKNNINNNNKIKNNNNIKNNQIINNQINNVKNTQIKNNNINNNQINSNQKNNMPQQHNISSIIFNAVCGFCRRYPINQVIYYCKECNVIFCSSCENQIGAFHEHAYFKVQNPKQFYLLDIGKASAIDKFMDNFDNAIETAVDSVVGFFNPKNVNNNNMNNYNNYSNINNINPGNNQQVMQSQRQFSLIEQARSRYELSNVSDKQIEEALKKSGNNIDEAIIFLFSK